MRRLGLLLLTVLCLTPLASSATGPQRIASCSLASDEILVTLLKERGELNRLVGVSLFATDPRYSNVVDDVPASLTGRIGGELESLLALKPDLAILASYNKPEMLARLEGAKVQVLRLTEFRNLDDIEHNIRTLGDVVGAKAEATRMLEAFRARRADVRAAATKRNTHPKILDFSEDGTVSGAGTLFDALVTEAGGIGLAAAQGLKNWPKVSTEALAVMRPDVLVTAGDPAKAAEYLAKMRSLPGWKEMPAVKAGRLIVIPAKELSAVSPHVLDALQKLALGLAG